MTLGITDLGTVAFERMTINAAAQAGAAYAVNNAASTCATLSSSCLSGIEAAMGQAVGNSSFCNKPSVCSASIGGCADGSPKCIIASASYPFSAFRSASKYSYWWAPPLTLSSTVTLRIL
jgi:hypothetical protein